jgi:hypothetical protein
MIDYNFLSDFTGLYSSDTNGTKYTASTYTHDWEFLNVSTTVGLETTDLRHSSRYVLSLRNPISEPYTFQSPIIDIPNEVLEKDFVFHAMFYCSYPAFVQIFLYNWDNDHSSVTPITTQLSAGEWTACFSNIFQFEDKNEPIAHARVRIVVSQHNSKIVRFTMPHLVYDKPFLDNTYYTYGQKYFPDVYYEIDSQQVGPTFPFMKLWHSLTSVAEGAMKEYIKILPTEYEELSVELKTQVDSAVYKQFLSSLTNSDVIDDNYVQWASMFIGNLIKNGIYVVQDVVQQVPITYQIGDVGPGGGEIFITPDTPGNNTGKYFEALNTAAAVMWTDTGNAATSTPSASIQVIGGGYSNTTAIVALGPSEDFTIETVFASLTYGGYSDWFVPSKEELEALHSVREQVDISFYEDNYWSSTESNSFAAWVKDFGVSGLTQSYGKLNTVYAIPVRMFTAGTQTNIIPGTVAENVIPSTLDFKRRQISSRMYGFSAGTKGALRNAARSVIGEEAAVLITPNWNNDEWSIMVRTLTASTPGVSGSGQSSSAVYYTMEPAKPAGYTLMHQTIDEITFVLDDNDFGVFNQSVLG